MFMSLVQVLLWLFPAADEPEQWADAEMVDAGL